MWVMALLGSSSVIHIKKFSWLVLPIRNKYPILGSFGENHGTNVRASGNSIL